MPPTSVNWAFYERLAALYRVAGEVPPPSVVVCLHEIADEDAAVALLSLIDEMAHKPVEALEVAKAVLAALDQYRNQGNVAARPLVEPLGQLQRVDPHHRVGDLRRLLSNPDTARVVLIRLATGARAVGLDPYAIRGLDASSPPPNAGPCEGNWALRLAENEPNELETILNAAIANKPKPARNFHLLRRLLDLAKKPTQRRLANLLADARGRGRLLFGTTASALRFGARNSVFQGRDLPQRWLSEIAARPADLARVAKRAHALLMIGVYKSGHAADADLDRYCKTIAFAYMDLSGKTLTYTRATPASKACNDRKALGRGLDFMLSALRLIDRSADEAQARYQIDLLNRPEPKVRRRAR